MAQAMESLSSFSHLLTTWNADVFSVRNASMELFHNIIVSRIFGKRLCTDSFGHIHCFIF